MPRADRAYIRSLLSLYASPAPGSTPTDRDKSLPAPPPPLPLENSSRPCALGWKGLGKRPKAKRADSAPVAGGVMLPEKKYVWKVPAGTLSGAGRLVVLRGDGDGRREGDVRAEVTCDEEMRGVVFGDPVMREFFLSSLRLGCGI